jgi:hypothetical protein
MGLDVIFVVRILLLIHVVVVIKDLRRNEDMVEVSDALTKEIK